MKTLRIVELIKSDAVDCDVTVKGWVRTKRGNKIYCRFSQIWKRTDNPNNKLCNNFHPALYNCICIISC